MKKILLLLLLSTSLYAQNPTRFASGVQITGGITTDNLAPVVVVKSANNVLNTISKSDLVDAIIVDNATQLTTAIGNVNKLYATRDNNIIYRYNGTIYVPMSADVSGKEDIANKSSSFTASSTVTYANTKALVDGLAGKANDADVVKLTGFQTVAGQKNFTNAVGISSSSYSSSGLFNLQGNSSFPTMLATNGGSGKTITTIVTNGVGFSSNISSGFNGLNFEGQNNGTNTFTVNKEGNIVANTYTGGATLTGTPTAPTPTTTTGIANKSYVDGLDSGNVKLSTVQTISGVKTFSGATLQANAITATSFINSTAPAGNVLLAGGGTLAQTGLPYLPLTGGTLTGALNGTNAVFSSSVQSSSFFRPNSVSGTMATPLYETLAIYGLGTSNLAGVYGGNSFGNDNGTYLKLRVNSSALPNTPVDAITLLPTGASIFANTVRLKGFTVATLPAGVIGDTAFVTDALAPSYLVTVMGGGAVATVVFYNGTNWVSH